MSKPEFEEFRRSFPHTPSPETADTTLLEDHLQPCSFWHERAPDEVNVSHAARPSARIRSVLSKPQMLSQLSTPLKKRAELPFFCAQYVVYPVAPRAAIKIKRKIGSVHPRTCVFFEVCRFHEIAERDAGGRIEM